MVSDGFIFLCGPVRDQRDDGGQRRGALSGHRLGAEGCLRAER